MSTDTLARVATKLLNQEARCFGSPGVPCDLLLRDLLKVIAERPEESAEQLRPTIRRVIGERAFASPCDSAIACDQGKAIDAQADMLVRILERVRHQAVEQGAWSTMPAAPVMCG